MSSQASHDLFCVCVGMHMATVSYLLTVQRCTESVFKQWKSHCGKYVTLGHQYSGVLADMWILPRSDDFDKAVQITASYIEKVVKTELEAGWRPKDIVVLIDDNFMHGWDAHGEIWELLKKSINIYPIGKTMNLRFFWIANCFDLGITPPEGAIACDFMSGFGKIHSFEWPLVICARGESNHEEFRDYVVRSRAIFKLIILQYQQIIKEESKWLAEKDTNTDKGMNANVEKLFSNRHEKTILLFETIF